MYTIGQVSSMFQLPISTLRYYDKEGLFPNIQRTSGIRKFDEPEIESLRVIECLKKSGMDIKGIKQFMDWCQQGSQTYPQRKALFEKRKQEIEDEIERLHKVLDMANYKCWYYDQAIKNGNEDFIQDMSLDQMPEEIKQAYLNSHE